MKKTFRSILAGALALLTVSCYDDTALIEQINGLDERVSAIEAKLNADVNGINDLAARLAAAEAALTSTNTSVNEIVARLDAFDGAVDGAIKDFQAAIAALTAADKALSDELVAAVAKIAVVKVEEVNGNVELTLADGKKVSLSKPLANVENTGLVTIVDGEWAVVLADGTTKSLGVAVGLALDFQVSAAGELQYAVNGGEWNATGVNVSDLAPSQYFIADVEEGEDSVTITIGDFAYSFPKYSADKATLVIKSGKTIFAYGETKEFALQISGISKYYVMTKPDGWKASVNGNTLVVTAPAEANVYAEAAGEVLLHANTADGKCLVAKLAVTTALDLKLVVDEANGTFDLYNAMLVEGERYDPLEGVMMPYSSFAQVAVGIASIEYFEKDPEGYITAVNNYELPYEEVGQVGFIDNIYSNLYDTYFEYTPGVCEVAEYTGIDIATFYRTGTYEAMPKGSKFIIWAAPVNMDTYELDPAGLVFAYYAPVTASVELVGEPVFNDMNVSLALYGADSYIVGKVAKMQAMDYMTGQVSLQSYIENGFLYMQYGMNSLGLIVPESGEYEFALSEIYSDMEEPMAKLAPLTEYFVYVIPVTNGKDWGEYDYAKDVAPYVKEFTTAGLQPGGEATVEFEAGESDFTTIRVNVTPSVETATVYWNFYSPEAIDEIEDLAGDVIAYGTPSVGACVATQNVSGPGTAMTLVALAVDSEGKYGDLMIGSFSSNVLEYSTTFAASFGEETYAPYSSGYKYDFPINVEGGSAAKYYRLWTTTEYSDEKVQKLPLGYSAGFYSGFTTVANPTGVLTGLYANAGQTYYLYVVVESAEGEFAPVIKKTVVVPAAE